MTRWVWSRAAVFIMARFDVGLDGGRAHGEPLGDLEVGESLPDKDGDRQFAIGEIAGHRSGRGAVGGLRYDPSGSGRWWRRRSSR